MKVKSVRWVVLAAIVSALVDPSRADCGSARPTAPLAGGVVVAVDGVVFELVAAANRLELYVRARDKPIDVFEIEATVTLISGKSRQTVQLEPGDDRLEAIGSFGIRAGHRALAAISGGRAGNRRR